MKRRKQNETVDVQVETLREEIAVEVPREKEEELRAAVRDLGGRVGC